MSILSLVVVVQLLSHVQFFASLWTAACQASLSFTLSQSLLKLVSFELVMPSNHLIFFCPLLFLLSIFPSIRVFFGEAALHIRWPKYWGFSFSNSTSSEGLEFLTVSISTINRFFRHRVRSASIILAIL